MAVESSGTRATRLPFLSARRVAETLAFELLRRTSGGGRVLAWGADGPAEEEPGVAVPDLPTGRGFGAEDAPLAFARGFTERVSSSETGSCFTLTATNPADGCGMRARG